MMYLFVDITPTLQVSQLNITAATTNGELCCVFAGAGCLLLLSARLSCSARGRLAMDVALRSGVEGT